MSHVKLAWYTVTAFYNLVNTIAKQNPARVKSNSRGHDVVIFHSCVIKFAKDC